MGVCGRLACGPEVDANDGRGKGVGAAVARRRARAHDDQSVPAFIPAGSMVPLKAVALPAAVWVVFSAIWLAALVLGIPRGFDGRTMTLTEATAVASHADVARLLQSGADPNAPARLRAHLVRNNEMTITPLEAATGAIRTG